MSVGEFTTIRVEGLQETLRAFGRIDKGLRRELGSYLKKVADLAAVSAREIAEANGLHESGKLAGSIRSGLRRSTAYVTATARKKSPKYPAGFNYPAVYEYGGRAAGERTGPRAFLHPAVDKEANELVYAMEGLLDRLTSEAGFGEGGVL